MIILNKSSKFLVVCITVVVVGNKISYRTNGTRKIERRKISMFRWKKKKPNGSSILPFGLFQHPSSFSIQYDQNLTLYQTMSDLVANPAIQGAELLLVPKQFSKTLCMALFYYISDLFTNLFPTI